MKYPLLSIVIANYNYGRFLEEAIQSVVNQNMGDNVELIICDAASTDNSIDIIKKYACGLPANVLRSEWNEGGASNQSINRLVSWWCSEKDGGQSAAFNKGFMHARGKYLTWLNADDVMQKGCLQKICYQMERHPDCEWFTGNFFRFLESRKVIEIGWGPHWYPNWLQRKNSPLVIFGPTSFFTKNIYESVGKIREDMFFMMDNDLWFRFMNAGVKMRRLRFFCWGFRMHETSKTAEYGEHILSETQAKRFAEERRACLERTGYRQSSVLRLICLGLRILDGSLLRKCWYMVTLKTYSEES